MEHLAVEGNQISFFYKGRGTSPILKELDIRVLNATIYGLLGPSGCGKTTLLRCIVGMLQPQSGQIKIYGRKPGESGFCVPGNGIGYMPQELSLHRDLTVEETLRYFGRLFYMSKNQITERINFLIELLNLPDKNNVIKNLSGGQKRRVSFSVALIHKPPLLILDEPTVGVDPVLRESIWNHLKTLALNDHVTIIITTHYIEEARFADTVGLIRDGRLLAEQNPQNLIEQHGLQTLEEVFLKLSSQEEQQLLTSVSCETLTSELDMSVTCSYPSLSRSLSCDLEGNVQCSSEAFNKVNSSPISTNRNFIFDKRKNILQNSSKVPDMLIYRKDTHLEQSRKSLLRLNTLMLKRFIELKRNIPALLFQLILPTIQVVMFCIFIGQDPKDLSVAIVNADVGNPQTQRFLDLVDSNIITQVPYDNLSLAIDSVKSGQNWGALHIGPNFTTYLLERYLEGSTASNETLVKSTIKLYLDMTNQQITLFIQRAITDGFQVFSKDLLKACNQNPLMAEYPVMLADPVYGTKDTSFTEFIVPNVLLSINHFLAVGLTALIIVIEKKEGLLERSMVAGVNGAEIIFTTLCCAVLVMIIQVVVVLLVVLPVFQLTVQGSIIWVFVCVLMAGSNGMTLGLLISAVCDNENTAIMLCLSTFGPVLALSGIIWPIEGLPSYLKYISYCFPLTLLGETTRSVMLRGWSVSENFIWVGLLVSLVWIVISTLLAGIIFKYKNKGA